MDEDLKQHLIGMEGRICAQFDASMDRIDKAMMAMTDRLLDRFTDATSRMEVGLLTEMNTGFDTLHDSFQIVERMNQQAAQIAELQIKVLKLEQERQEGERRMK